MSGVLWHHKVPHIIQYGMRSEEEEKCWVSFWRNGVHFTVTVEGDDVRGTIFHKTWKPFLTEWRKGEESLSRRITEHWYPLCDLIISAAMSTLQDLASSSQHWTTLSEYLHTPAYTLRLVRAENLDEVKAEVIDGPKDTAAYELSTISVEESGLPSASHLPHFYSQDLTVLDHSRDWRRGPEKIRTPNGQVYFFQGCARSIRNQKTQKITNTSLDSLRAQLKIADLLHKTGKVSMDDSLSVAIPAVCAIVVDGSRVAPDAAETSSSGLSTRAGFDDFAVAGILVPWMSGARTLSEVTHAAMTSTSISAQIMSNREDWKAQIHLAVDYLHRQGVTFGGESNWSYLNQKSIVIDRNWRAWLTMLPTFAATEGGPHSENKPQKAVLDRDVETVKVVFDDWLLSEMSKAPMPITTE